MNLFSCLFCNNNCREPRMREVRMKTVNLCGCGERCSSGRNNCCCDCCRCREKQCCR